MASGETREISPGAVFVFIGLLPNTGFLRGVADLDSYGFITTQANLETSLPGVFAPAIAGLEAPSRWSARRVKAAPRR